MKDFYLMLDGIQAILALTKHFDCDVKTRNLAIKHLANLVRRTHENSFEAGFVAFFFAFNPDIIDQIRRDHKGAAKSLIFLKEFPKPQNVVLHAAIEMVEKGRCTKIILNRPE